MFGLDVRGAGSKLPESVQRLDLDRRRGKPASACFVVKHDLHLKVGTLVGLRVEVVGQPLLFRVYRIGKSLVAGRQVETTVEALEVTTWWLRVRWRAWYFWDCIKHWFKRRFR